MSHIDVVAWPTEDTIYTYNGKKKSGRIQIYAKKGDKWSKIGKIKLGSKPIKKSCFNSNLTSVYFSTQRKGGLGGQDLYVSHKDENGKWVVTSVQLAEDGAGYDASLMKICENDKALYDAFTIDEKSGKDNRAAFIREYLASNGMDLKGYQDYGWDPVDITIDQEVYTGGYDFGK